MPKEYVGKTRKWARDEKQALSFLCISKPSKDGYCITKKGARLQIVSVTCISQPTTSKNIERPTIQESAPFSLDP